MMGKRNLKRLCEAQWQPKEVTQRREPKLESSPRGRRGRRRPRQSAPGARLRAHGGAVSALMVVVSTLSSASAAAASAVAVAVAAAVGLEVHARQDLAERAYDVVLLAVVHHRAVIISVVFPATIIVQGGCINLYRIVR